jgi:hypothetical protein
MAGSSAYIKRKKRRNRLDIMADAVAGETLEQLAQEIIDARKHRNAPMFIRATDATDAVA